MKRWLGRGTVETPVGAIRFAVNDGGAVVALGFDDQWPALARGLERRFGSVAYADDVAAAADVGGRLAAYLFGELDALAALEVDPGGTPFRRCVWSALRAIPAGTTCSYADIAAAIGSPHASRAVGAANGANPVSIVVPCHRVVASDGTLHGYGGGLRRKAWLLRHEGASWERSAHSKCSPAVTSRS